MDTVRHARGKDDWGPSPSRSAQRAEAVTQAEGEPKRAPGRKDSARCKGNHGGPHLPVIQLHHPAPEDEFRARCRWAARWILDDHEFGVGWSCGHERVCSGCGLIIDRRIDPEGCPAYPGAKEQRAVAGQDAFECNERRRTRATRRPAITGPQGYRRKRGEA